MTRPAIAPASTNRRALVLPGGGMRVAYQAGAVQALHQAGLRFSYADGTSGGLINLAALLSGVAPDDLVRRWRSLRPISFVSPQSPASYLGFPNITAFGDFDGIRKRVFPHLGVDLDRLKSSTGVAARFNVCDFASKAVNSLRQDEMSLNHLLAGISLPILTPAVETDGRTFTDAVWIRNSNLMEAVRAGANEVWVVWCIGNTPRFRRGILRQYVHMIEMSALGAFNAELAEVARLNAEIAAGGRPHGHGEPVVVHVIRPDLPIPLDPDYVAGRISGDALVDQGYRDAIAYLTRRAAAGSPLDNRATSTAEPGRGISFREAMAGRIVFGAEDTEAGGADPNGIPLVLRATIDIRDAAAFVADPGHRGEMVAHVYSPRLGGLLPAGRTNFQLFAPGSGPDEWLMVYEAGFVSNGRPYWLSGRKFVRRGPPWRLWRETTTLHVTLHEGDDAGGRQVAAGILRLGAWDFMALLAGLHARDCTGIGERIDAVFRFGRFFAGRLWRSYGLRG